MIKKYSKLIFVVAFVVLTLTLFSVQVFARDFYMAGHYDATGNTTTTYAYSASECDRVINVSFYDTSGNFLKKVVVHTKRGDERSVHIGIGGYDIVKFESNQGLWETCKMAWTSGTGLCTEADLYITYYFRTALSKDELNVTVTMRPWDSIEFEVRHYVEQDPTKKYFWRDSNYSLHSVTNQQTLEYYDYFTTSKKTISGYTLRSEYQSSVSGYLCFEHFVGLYENTPSSPRCYEYDYHNTDYSEPMDTVSKYDESKDGKLDYCDNRKFWVEYFYDINEYTITFNANGGSGAPEAQTKYHGFDLTLSETIPTRSGYTFKGWGTYASDTSSNYEPGGNYTGNANRTLYAIWESDAPQTYTVKYNANGGSGAPSNQAKTHGATLTLSSTKPTRSGYTFKGWATSSTATSATYQAGGSYTSNANVTLYAVWSQNPVTYTVSYNANGGSGAPSSQTKTQNVTLTLSSTKPTRSGYTFKGWSTSSYASSPTYYAGGSYTANASATLYAVWSANSVPSPTTYTISYNANGGSGAPSSQTKTQGVTLTLSSVTPTRSGYTFLGWSTSSTATSPSYYAGGSYTTNVSTTLYAVWSKNAATTYTVSYNANGGSGAPSSQTKTQGVTLTLSSTKPTRSGYSFLGWSTSSTATSPSYYAGGSYTTNASATLYAVWSKNAATTYTVSYNANGGSGAPSSQTKTEGVTLYLSTTEPYRANYEFLGWSTSSTATTPTYYAGSAYTANASRTLYAVWKYSPASYTVSYNANGGSGAPSSQRKTYDVDLALSYTEPTRSGYDFKGWATSSLATSATYQPGDIYTANASVTLYAVWDEANYDFSISNLTVSDSNPYKYDQITVSVRTDSWDQVNSYADIPVQLYYRGSLVSTQYVDFNAYGVANLTFTLNVGNSVGDKTIEARINWADHNNETRTGNNSVSTTVTVQDYDYEMSAGVITPSDGYAEGMDVITSFTVSNDSDFDIIPSSRNNALFTAYYYNGSQKVVINTQRWNNVVIPSGGTNLVYFKWTVPDGLAGKTVYCECTINADEYLNEENRSDNTSTYSTRVISLGESQTPNTRYESQAPEDYQVTSAPYANANSATWTRWEYENGAFVLKRYGLTLSSARPVITPDENCTTAKYQNGQWTMKSGYGISLSYAPTLAAVNGYSMPTSDAYTGVQYAEAYFPEYTYSTFEGEYRTLEYASGGFTFVENSSADENARLHFIPVYVSDGEYVVSVLATQVWTPAGVISTVQTSQPITIDGSIFDDFYFGAQ